MSYAYISSVIYKSRNALSQEQIAEIRHTYSTVRDIHKTAKLTKHSAITVAKYASDLIAEDRRSCYLDNTLYQIDPITLKILAPFSSITEASQATLISESNIRKAVKGKTKTAGGYIWVYKDEYNADLLKPIGRYFVSESKRIDRILGLV